MFFECRVFLTSSPWEFNVVQMSKVRKFNDTTLPYKSNILLASLIPSEVLLVIWGLYVFPVINIYFNVYCTMKWVIFFEHSKIFLMYLLNKYHLFAWELAPKVQRYSLIPMLSFPWVSRGASPAEEEELQRIAYTWIMLVLQVEELFKLKHQWILI